MKRRGNWIKKLIITLIAAIAAVLVLSGFFMTTVFSQEFSFRTDLDWKISVGGSVPNPLQLTLAELIEMPRTTVQAELSCNGQPLASGEWTGVKLSFVMEKAGIIDPETAVTLTAQDGYGISTHAGEIAILAYELDGVPLPETIRLVVPGANGEVWIKWITQIIVTPVSPPIQFWRAPLQFTQNPMVQAPYIAQHSSPALNVSVPELPTSQSTVQQHPDPQSASQPAEQWKPFEQELADSTKPLDYGYLLVAVAVATSVATGIFLVKHRKTIRP